MRKMFAKSTQLKHWTLAGTTEISRLRTEANQKFCQQHGQKQKPFLVPKEELQITRHYAYVLHDFCKAFQPPMPKYVIGTAMMFFKRFYLHNSVMDFHPKYIFLVCCYLACKVEEFNVSLTQFIGNCHGNQDHIADIILSHELLLMQLLHYHLTVHNPYRPLEGLIIDVKTRCSEVGDVEVLRGGADDFLDRALHTDVSLIYAPSQIALSALLSSASKAGVSLDSYVAQTLLSSGGREALTKIQEQIKRIRFYVKNVDPLDRSEVKRLEKQLAECQNPQNDPDSPQYAMKLQELEEEEEDRQVRKKQRIAEEERQREKEILGY